MEYLLHYVWQHRLYPPETLCTQTGQLIEVIDPGVHNMQQSGPDFFNAKLRIEGVIWAGNVEIHERASDWYRHHHETDAAYNNVILHVVGQIDREVQTADGKTLPQVSVKVPEHILNNYHELTNEETYPPCYRIVPHLEPLHVHALDEPPHR